MKKSRSGQAMVEYIIIVVVIGIAALVVFGLLGDTIKEKVSGSVSSLTTSDKASEAQSEAQKKSSDQIKDMTAEGI